MIQKGAKCFGGGILFYYILFYWCATTLEFISDSVSIGIGAAQLSSLGISKVCARLVPKILIPEQKQGRVKACQQLLDQVGELGDAFLKRLVI